MPLLTSTRVSLVNYQQLMLCRCVTLWLSCRELENQESGRQLSELGNISAALANVVQESTVFITACYGYEKLNNVGCSVQDVKSEHCKSQ